MKEYILAWADDEYHDSSGENEWASNALDDVPYAKNQKHLKKICKENDLMFVYKDAEKSCEIKK